MSRRASSGSRSGRRTETAAGKDSIAKKQPGQLSSSKAKEMGHEEAWTLQQALSAKDREARRKTYIIKRPLVTVEEVVRYPLYAAANHLSARAKKVGSSLQTESGSYPADSKINKRIGIHLGDITQLELDAIVNAANSGLSMGGGVCGSVFRYADPALMQEYCDLLDGCPAGSAKTTPGFLLPALHVVHAVGPKTELPDVLAAAYRASLQECVLRGFRTVALPCLSTGVYGYPHQRAARIALREVRLFLQDHLTAFDLVVFALFSQADIDAYSDNLAAFFPIPVLTVPADDQADHEEKS